MNVGIIDHAWNNHVNKTCTRNNEDTRNAFFAGATILYGLIMGNLSEDGNDEKDMKLLQSIHDELIDFAQIHLTREM